MLKNKKRRFLASLILGIAMSGSCQFSHATDYGNVSVSDTGVVTLLDGKTDYSLLSGEYIPGTDGLNLSFETNQSFTNEGGIGYTDENTATPVGNINAGGIGVFTNKGLIDFTGTMTVSDAGLENYGRIDGNAAGGVSSEGTVVNGLANDDPGSILTGSVSAVGGISNYATLDGLNTTSLLSTTNAAIINTGVIRDYSGITANSLQNGVGGSINGNSTISVTTSLTNNGSISATTAGSGSISTSLLNNQADSSISNFGTITASDSLVNSGTIDSITTINANGTLENSTSGVISNVESIVGGTTGAGSAPGLTNKGTMENIGSISGSMSLEESGVIKMTGDNKETKVNGSLAVNGGTMEVRLTPVSGETATPGVDNDFYNLNGTNTHADLTVNGGSLKVVADDYDPANPDQVFRAGDRYTVIQGNDITVNEELTVNGQLGPGYKGLLRYVASYDDDNYYLGLERSVIYSPFGNTENSSNMAQYIDSLGNRYTMGSDMENVLVALDQYSNGNPGAARSAMAQLDGAVYGSMATMAMQNQSIVNNELANRLRPTQSGGFLSCCQDVNCNCCTPCTQFWGNYYGVNGDVDSDGNAFGGDYSVNGVIVGGDRILSENFRLGGFFAFGSTEYDVNGLNEIANSDSYKAGLYFLRSIDSGYFLGHFNYGWDNNNVERNISFLNRTNTADFSGTQWAFRLEKGFNFDCNGALLQPFAALHYTSYESDAFNETGFGSTAMSIDASSFTSWRSELGGRLVWSKQRNDSVLSTLFLQASWLHEYTDTRGTVSGSFANSQSSQFTGDGKYTVYGVDLGRDWCNLGVGLDVAINNLNVFGGYDFLFNGDQSLNTGNVGLAYHF